MDTRPNGSVTYELLMLHFCKSFSPTNHDILASASQLRKLLRYGMAFTPVFKKTGLSAILEERDFTTFNDLMKLHDRLSPKFDGFQLNISWPELRQLDEYRTLVGYKPRLVLQIGRRAVEEANNTPSRVADLVSIYEGVVNDILFDLSGGEGIEVDVERARMFLDAIANSGVRMGLGVAGGLGPNTLELIQPLAKEFPGLNTDATGKLMGPDNRLDMAITTDYIQKAFKLPTGQSD